MLFIEQPVGVGFSYSNDSNDYTIGDAQAAQDMYNFILQFFQQPEFTSFADNEFYITSESYGKLLSYTVLYLYYHILILSYTNTI